MSFKSFLNLFESIDNSTLQLIDKAITAIGPTVELFIVGGAVRDKLLGIQSKDIDFVVTKMPFDNDEQALQAIYDALHPLVAGKVNKVGESFGIVTATINGEDFDFAIPRRKENKTGDGHSDFDIELDPTASVHTDLSRRDFTINAMAQSINGTLVDPFNGQSDLKKGIIRTVGDAQSRFAEDPLRMMRALQFASRLSTTDGDGFTIDDKTLAAIKEHGHMIGKHISGERILAEFEKAWTKGRANILTFIELLDETGIGKDLFGSDFDPRPVSITGTDKDQKIARFVGMFAEGGDKEFLKIHPNLSTYYMDHLELFKNILADEKEPWEYVRSHKDKIPLVAKIAEGLKVFYGENPATLARKMMQIPILPKELAVNGMDLMKHGFKGSEIGAIQRKLLSALWSGKINNTKENIIDLIEKEKED